MVWARGFWMGQGENRKKDDNQEWLSSVCILGKRERLQHNFLGCGTKLMFRDSAKSAVSKVWESNFSFVLPSSGAGCSRHAGFNEGTTTEQVT
jgi:hypothetical protein